MKFFRRIRKLIIFITIIMIIIYHKNISTYILNNYIYNKNATLTIEKNNYSKNIDYGFVQITEDFLAKDYQHLLNIFYTILDSGENKFYFYCDDGYKDCLEDINNLMPKDSAPTALSDINNFVHPYNSYQLVTVKTNNFGKVTVQITKQYNNDNIKYINEQLELIKSNILTNDMNEKQSILAFHDYIINNTKYDITRADNMDDPIYKDSMTHTAHGLLATKKALCGGYSDIMSIFLSQLNINNLRISADNHVWNLVYLDDWLHLDMTWDDPVTNTGEDFLIHDYFLITTKDLIEADEIEHKYNKKIYIEAK